jgi:plasmid stability protein
MPAVTIRNLSEETHRALKLRAALNGRSTEAEIRGILEAATLPRLKLGSALAKVGKRVGGVELKMARDAADVEPARFE